MSHPATCPLCGIAMQLPGAAPGQSFACPRCGAMLVASAGGALIAQGQAGPPLPQPSGNPFADLPGGFTYPGYAAGPFAPGYLPVPMTREAALAKVQGPAVLMQVMGGLIAVASLAMLLVLLDPGARNDEVLPIMLTIFAPLGAAVGGFTVYCGGQLKALRSYGLVMTGVVLLLGVAFLICIFAALPAIWPLIVLLDPGVRLHFRTPPPDESAYRSGKIM